MDPSVIISGQVTSASARTYTSEEWEQKRALITRLYRDQEKSLDHVRSVLAQQSFRPTAAMLKKRIRKWELDRNHKHADMLYAVQVALNRESQGKKTAFLIRGRVITFDEVQHYFRRRGVRDLRSLLKTADAAVPTTRIECRTPEPTKIATTEDHTHLKATGSPAPTSATQLHDASSEITVMPDPNQIATVLRQPEDLHKLDQLLRYGRDYYCSIFDGPDWRIPQKALELSPLENFYHSLAEGHVFLDAGQVTVAFTRFDYAFDLVKGILDDGPLLLLPYLYHLFLPGRGIGQQDVLLKVLEFISEMIRTRFPHLRPVQESLALLCGISCEQRRHYSMRIFQSVLDQLRSVFRDDAPSELQQATDLLCTPTRTDNFKITSRAIWKLSKNAELVETQTASPPAFRTPLHNYSSTCWRTSFPKCPYSGCRVSQSSTEDIAKLLSERKTFDSKMDMQWMSQKSGILTPTPCSLQMFRL